jgi:hypothetical protein
LHVAREFGPQRKGCLAEYPFEFARRIGHH